MEKEKLEEYLKSIKFDEMAIEEVIAYVETEKDVEALFKKIEVLHNNKVMNEVIEIILEENPLFLTTDLETVKLSVNFFKSIGFDNLSEIYDLGPELVSTSDKRLSENYKLLKIVLDEKELKKLINNNSEVLSYNTDYLGKRLEFFVKNGLKDKMFKVLTYDSEILDLEDDEIDLEALKNL